MDEEDLVEAVEEGGEDEEDGWLEEVEVEDGEGGEEEEEDVEDEEDEEEEEEDDVEENGGGMGAWVEDDWNLLELLTACLKADQVEALRILDLHPGLINRPQTSRTIDGPRIVYRGETAVMSASHGGNETLVLELLKRGADVNARCPPAPGMRFRHGDNALMLASEKGHAAVVNVLLKHGVDPNTRNEDWTALGLAAVEDHLPVCLLLVAQAADLYALNATWGGQNVLEGYGRNRNLTPAVLEERRAQLKLAYDEGPHPNARWARRKNFVMVLATTSSLTMFLPVAFPYDFQPTAARRAVLAALYPPLPPIPPLPAGTPEQKRALMNMAIFGHNGFWKLIASFL